MQTFVMGHKNPDTDSVIAAIAQAAYLKEMGEFAVPVVQNAPCPETLFALEKFGFETPMVMDGVGGKNIFIVDTNDPNQLPSDIQNANITGIIDHHHLVGGLKTPHPIPVMIRHYGCSCTIIAKNFADNKLPMSKELAGAMLCAILSDTVLFKSPTTTNEDRAVAEMLSVIAGVDITKLGMEMLKVKSDISGETAKTLLNRDLKNFNINGKMLAIGQIELIDSKMASPFMADLRAEMKALKSSQNLAGVMMIMTDIIREGSEILLETDFDDKVRSLFAADSDGFVSGLLSRKKQVIPILTDNL